MAGRALAEHLAAAVQRLGAGADDRELRAMVLDAIRALVPFDFYAFLLTDPTTSVGCSPVAKIPDLRTLPDLIALKYVTSVNRWTALPESGCATLRQATDGQPERSLVWREYLAALDVVDVASVVFTDRFGCWGFVDLWRRERCFTEVESAALAAARPSITARLRDKQAAAFTGPTDPPVQRGPCVLVLSPTLTVRAQTPQTAQWLSALLPTKAGHSPVPASAYNVAAQLLAKEAGVDHHPAQARVHLGDGAWLTLRAARLAGPRAVKDRDIVVSMESSSPSERRDVFCRAHALTARETEVMGHLADGDDTRTVARLMSISELTVQDHLKSIFAKTSASSRRELLARCLGR